MERPGDSVEVGEFSVYDFFFDLFACSTNSVLKLKVFINKIANAIQPVNTDPSVVQID